MGVARKPRIEFPGALYHVIVRGNNREDIFADDIEKNKYLDVISRYKERYLFRLFAFCIMDNHGHLLIEVDKVPLSKIMQGIQQVYTSFYNRKHKRVGHVFQQRYKALLCDKDSYLLSLIRYIHRNPFEGGITNDLNYKWSSHSNYIGTNKNNLVDIDFPLSLFSTDLKQAIQRYCKFISKTDEEFLLSDVELSAISSSEANIKEDASRSGVSLEKLLEHLSVANGLTRNEVLNSRARNIVEVRRLFICIAARNCTVSQKEIAKFLGVSEAAVAKNLAKFKETTEYRQVETDVLNKLIK